MDPPNSVIYNLYSHKIFVCYSVYFNIPEYGRKRPKRAVCTFK